MKQLLSKQDNQVIAHLRAREATNRPPKGPVGVLLKEGVLLLNTIPAIWYGTITVNHAKINHFGFL